jgi:hypothetical protein
VRISIVRRLGYLIQKLNIIVLPYL